MNLEQIKERWNTQSDEFNKWDNLGEDEKVEFAFSFGEESNSGMRITLTHEIIAEDGEVKDCFPCSDTDKIKSTLKHELDYTEYAELKSIVGVNDLCCACYEFESRLRELWKYDQEGMDYDTIDKIRDMWFDITGDVRWVLE